VAKEEEKKEEKEERRRGGRGECNVMDNISERGRCKISFFHLPPHVQLDYTHT
jgi:hypothetical protein